MTNSSTNSNKPAFQIKLPKGISAAVFQNKNTREGRTFRSINIQRSYRKDGKWHRDSIYLNHEQIPFMIDALERTWKYLNEFPLAAANNSADAESQQESQVDDAEDAVQDEAEAAA